MLQAEKKQTTRDAQVVACLDENSAIAIFLSKANHTARDSTSALLAARYGITMKAVRDVWNLRTWAWATMAHWSRADHTLFRKKYLCASCKRKSVDKLDPACKACAMPRRRGRPRVWDVLHCSAASAVNSEAGADYAANHTEERSEWRAPQNVPQREAYHTYLKNSFPRDTVQIGTGPGMCAEQVRQAYLLAPSGIHLTCTGSRESHPSPPSMSQQLGYHHSGPHGLYRQAIYEKQELEDYESTRSARYGARTDRQSMPLSEYLPIYKSYTCNAAGYNQASTVVANCDASNIADDFAHHTSPKIDEQNGCNRNLNTHCDYNHHPAFYAHHEFDDPEFDASYTEWWCRSNASFNASMADPDSCGSIMSSASTFAPMNMHDLWTTSVSCIIGMPDMVPHDTCSNTDFNRRTQAYSQPKLAADNASASESALGADVSI